MDPAQIDTVQQQLAQSGSVGQQRMLALHGGSRDALQIAPNLWAGIGLVRGGAGTALVGSHEQVAERIEELHELGFDELILSGHPHLEEAYQFGEGVLPILRRRGLVGDLPRRLGDAERDSRSPRGHRSTLIDEEFRGSARVERPRQPGPFGNLLDGGRASKFLTETGAMSFDLERARRDTPACARHAHLNNAGASLLPVPVVDAVRAHLDLEIELGGYEAAHDAATAADRVRSSVAALVGAEAAEIAFADSATRAWISAFTAIRFRPGDRILTSSSEYASNVIALLQAAERDGVTVDVVANDETGALSLPDLERLMDERVRLVAVTHVPTSSGLVNDVAGVGAIVAGSDALFLVDACQSVGQLPIDVTAIGCHLLSATGRKYLRAPRGTGFLYVDETRLDGLVPIAADLHSARWTGPATYELAADATRFELWEHSVANVLGLGAAADYALAWGVEETYCRIQALAADLRERLAAVAGVTVRDVGAERCGIVTFTVAGHEAQAVTSRLRAEGVHIWHVDAEASRFDMAERGLTEVNRASVHYYNTADELDALCRGLAAITAG